jgi:hypothetical protein
VDVRLGCFHSFKLSSAGLCLIVQGYYKSHNAERSVRSRRLGVSSNWGLATIRGRAHPSSDPYVGSRCDPEDAQRVADSEGIPQASGRE